MEDDARRFGIRKYIELRVRPAVAPARLRDDATHDDDFLQQFTKQGLLLECQRNVRQWPHRNQRHFPRMAPGGLHDEVGRKLRLAHILIWIVGERAAKAIRAVYMMDMPGRFHQRARGTGEDRYIVPTQHAEHLQSVAVDHLERYVPVHRRET